MILQRPSLLTSPSCLLARPSYREGPEIYSEVKVPFYDAILGASVKVPVVDGEVEIKVPPGTQPEQVRYIETRGESRGDSKCADILNKDFRSFD